MPPLARALVVLLGFALAMVAGTRASAAQLRSGCSVAPTETPRSVAERDDASSEVAPPAADPTALVPEPPRNFRDVPRVTRALDVPSCRCDQTIAPAGMPRGPPSA